MNAFQLAQEKAKLMKQLNSLGSQLNIYNENIEALKKEEKERVAHLSKIEKEIEQKKEEIGQITIKGQGALHAKEKYLNDLNEQIEKDRKSIAERSSIIETINKEQTKNEQSINKRNEELTNLTARLSKRQDEINSQEKQLEIKKKRVQGYISEYRTLIDKYVKIKEAAEKNTDIAKAAQGKLNKERSEFNKVRDGFNETLKEAGIGKEKILAQVNSIKEKQKKLGEVKQTIAIENTKLDEERKQLEAEKVKLKDEIEKEKKELEYGWIRLREEIKNKNIDIKLKGGKK